MKATVLAAITGPKRLTARGLLEYSPIRAVGNGMNDWSIRKMLFSHTIPYVAWREPADMMMVKPELAYDHEAYDPAEKFGHLVEQPIGQLLGAAGIFQRWNAEFEHQQCDDDGEDAVTKALDPIETQFFLFEVLQHINSSRVSRRFPALRD
jgi:hypothetical protein